MTGNQGEDERRRQDSGDTAGDTAGPPVVVEKLDAEQSMLLRLVGREWGRVSAAPGAWRDALPVDPDVGSYPEPAQIVPARFDRFVRVPPLGGKPSGAEVGEVKFDGEGSNRTGRFGARLRRAVLGAPLRSTAIAREHMRKIVALPVLSADALSSVAYGPEALLAVLVLGGTAGLGYSVPVSLAIVFLMLAVGLSYRQTIRAYPHGGGSYIVATDNLGRVPGLMAAAGLMTDYILTVAVSVSSGAAAVTSALPQLADDVVLIGVLVIAVLLAGNLRGVRQAGALFAAPTYAFIIAIFALVAVGVYDAAGRGFEPVPTPPLHATESVGLLLVMRAFASGSTAMTGIEAISNAVPAFQPVAWRNARTTLSWMIGLLITLFAGTVALVYLEGVVPRSQETVLSQLAHRSFGSGGIYVFTQAATALVLLLAANTAYNDFPRVLFLLARDSQAPSIFLRLGDRLAYSNGIIVLSVAAAVVYVAFDGKTATLIPLYAVGVFLGLHPVAERHGGALVAQARPALAQESVFQRDRRAALGARLDHGRNHQVHGGRVARDSGRRRVPSGDDSYSAPLRHGAAGVAASPADDRDSQPYDLASARRPRAGGARTARTLRAVRALHAVRGRRSVRRGPGRGERRHPRGDPSSVPRPDRRAAPGEHARAGVRGVSPAARSRPACQPQRRGRRAFP